MYCLPSPIWISTYLFNDSYSSRWVPESYRWLMVHGKAGEAEKVLSSIATINKKRLPGDKLSLEHHEEAVKEGGFFDLFRPRKQLFKTVILWFAW